MKGLGDITERRFARLVESMQAEFTDVGACIAKTI